MIDTPILEYTDIFLRKSGGELASMLYAFADPAGKNVSLRPEFTASSIRYFIENRESLSLPTRVQYAGPVFRYISGAGYSESYQVGAELIGDEEPRADAEIISIALSGLDKLGIEGLECRIGHIGVLLEILSVIGVSQRAQNFLVNNLHVLKNTENGSQTIITQAEGIGLIRPSANSSTGLDIAVGNMDELQAAQLLSDLFRDSLTDPLGNRTAGDILGRFISKYDKKDEFAKFEKAISLLKSIVSIQGNHMSVMTEMESLLSEYDIQQHVLSRFRVLIEIIMNKCPDANIILDLSLVRGIAYYTGMVFEIISTKDKNLQVLCGGGRYDGLVKALGGPEEISALGFAYTLENLFGDEF